MPALYLLRKHDHPHPVRHCCSLASLAAALVAAVIAALLSLCLASLALLSLRFSSDHGNAASCIIDSSLLHWHAWPPINTSGSNWGWCATMGCCCKTDCSVLQTDKSGHCSVDNMRPLCTNIILCASMSYIIYNYIPCLYITSYLYVVRVVHCIWQYSASGSKR